MDITSFLSTALWLFAATELLRLALAISARLKKNANSRFFA